MKQLHLTLTEDSPVFQRALARSKTGARGHIGTHLDCYTNVPHSFHFHTGFDILCEKSDCHVIENVNLLPLKGETGCKACHRRGYRELFGRKALPGI